MENSICSEACGSRDKYKKYFCFSNIATCPDPVVKQSYDQVLARLNLHQDHIDEVVYLKENGNDACQKNLPKLSVKAWSKILEDGTDFNDSNLRVALLAAPRHYFPVENEYDPWDITFSRRLAEARLPSECYPPLTL